MKITNKNIILFQLYWIIHIAIILFLAIDNKSRLHIFIFLYLCISVILSCFLRKEFKAIGSVMQFLYALYFIFRITYNTYVSQGFLNYFILIYLFVNGLNLFIPIYSLIFYYNRSGALNSIRRFYLIIISVIFFVMSIWSSWYFYYKDIEMRKKISQGNSIIKMIEILKLHNDRLPNSWFDPL